MARVAVYLRAGSVIGVSSDSSDVDVAVIDMDQLATVGVYEETEAAEVVKFHDGVAASTCKIDLPIW